MAKLDKQNFVSTTTTRQALGQHGSIGTLYDIRTDKVENLNLFDEQEISSSIITTDYIVSNYFVDEHQSQKDTWNKLSIESSMQISLMSNLIDPAPEYLYQAKDNNYTARVTFVFDMRTKKQRLSPDNIPGSEHLSKHVIQNVNATHFIVGITWGTRLFIKFEDTFRSVREAEQVQLQLVSLLKAAYINSHDEIQFENFEHIISHFSTMKINIYSDHFKRSEVSTSIDSLQNIINDAQSALRQLNNGNGQQIEFELQSIEEYAQINHNITTDQRRIIEISDNVTNKIEKISSEIMQDKKLINDFFEKLTIWYDWIPQQWIQVILDKQLELNTLESQRRKRLATLLRQVRYGEISEKEIIIFLDEYHKGNPYSPTSIETFLNSNSRIDFKIDVLSQFDLRTGQVKQANADVLLKRMTSMENFISNYFRHDIYMLHISNQWIAEDKRNWEKQFKCFCKLQDNEQLLETNRTIFRVIDHDLHTNLMDKPNNCAIYYIQRGAIITRDFYRTNSLKTLSFQQIRAIRTQNSFKTLTDKDIEKWHEKFIKAHPTGEMNKEEFICEFQQLYPNGDPRKYCHYAFESIDRDHSGTISFEEFMSTVSLTVPGDINKQLALIFDVCDHDHSQRVSCAELIKFLEVVAELESGSASIDHHKIPRTAKNMRKYCGKINIEDEISKDEFIACLKNRYELCMAFLPIVTKKLSDNDIDFISRRHPTLTQSQILEWHKQFLNEHFGGELTKAGFIDEYKKLYPNGNPTPYCNYIFKAIDKDKSGTINFLEFTEAVALTQSGNIDTRLKLIFTICDKDESGTISYDEIIKTMEVIAELRTCSKPKRQNLQSIADTIMAYCGKSDNKELTETEFISCCKTNEELCQAFLPRATRKLAVEEQPSQCNFDEYSALNEIQIYTRDNLSQSWFQNIDKSKSDYKHNLDAASINRKGTLSAMYAAYGTTLHDTFVEPSNLIESSDNISHVLKNRSTSLDIAIAIGQGEPLPIDFLSKILAAAKENTDKISSINAKYILCAHAACHNGFIEPMYFTDLPQPFTTENDLLKQYILWAFALTLPCSSVVNEDKIAFLFKGLNDDRLGECVAFIFRKLSESQTYLDIVPNNIWNSIVSYVANKELNEKVRITIVYIAINIFNNKTEISNKIKQQFETLVNDIYTSKKLLIAVLIALYTVVTSGSSLLSNTLERLRELVMDEDSMLVHYVHQILDYVDEKRTLSNSVRYSFNSQVKSELTATQNTSVSHSEEEAVEPTAKFLALDNLLGKNAHLDRSFNREIEPNIVESGDNQSWHRTTHKEIMNLKTIAKQGRLKDKDFSYLLDKMKDGWHWFSTESRDSFYETIAAAFRDSAKATQRIPSDVVDHLIYCLYGETQQLSRTCSDCLLIIVRNQQSINDTQVKSIEDTLQETNDTEVKKNLIEICALYASKGHHVDLNLSSIEENLKNPDTCEMVSYLFFKAAAVEKQIFTNEQSIILCEVGKSLQYNAKARENCLWAIAYSINNILVKQSISIELINSLSEILKEKNETIRHAAAVALCYYGSDDNCCISYFVLENLAMILNDKDYGLLNNVLSIYLKIAKGKQNVPLVALNNLGRFLETDAEFSLKEKSIWILKYCIENRQDLNAALLNSIDTCLNDSEFRIRNTAATAFLEYWNRKILESEGVISRTFISRMDNLLLFFQNQYDFSVRKDALEFLNTLTENNYSLSETLFDLIEYCLYDRDPSIANYAITVIISYSKRNSLTKRIKACLEYILTIDTNILPSVITVLKTVVYQGHILSEKTIGFLGNLLFKSINPNDIIILLTYADRHQPLPKNVNILLQQHYYIEVLRNSICSDSLEKAYAGLLSLTDDGIQLSKDVLRSIFSLLQSPKFDVRLIRIVANVTSNGQHLNNENINVLSQIYLKKDNRSLLDSMKIWTNIVRQNHDIPVDILDTLEKSIHDESVNIYAIEIYQLLIERRKLIDHSIIENIFLLLDPIKWLTNNTDLNCRLVSFFKAVVETCPSQINQKYFPSFLQPSQPVAVRKDASNAAKILAEHHQILQSETVTALIYLLNNDDNIEIQEILLQTLEYIHANQQIQNHNLLTQLIDLRHCQDVDDDKSILSKLKAAAEAGLKLYDKHFTKLCRMLFSCDINLKKEAAAIIALTAAHQQILPKKVLDAVYATLLDETINNATLSLLNNSKVELPATALDDLFYLILHSEQTCVRQLSWEILKFYKSNPKVMSFKIFLSMNKLTLLLNESGSVGKLINSNDDHQIRIGLQIVQNMIIIQRRIPNNLLFAIVSRLSTHSEIFLDLLILALNKNVKFDDSMCEEIEKAAEHCASSKMVLLLRMLTDRQFLLKNETLELLITILKTSEIEEETQDDIIKIIDYLSQYRPLSNEVLEYFINQLSNVSSDIARQSFQIIHQQIIKQYIDDPTDLLNNVRLPNGIDYNKLSQLNSANQRLGTVLTLLSVQYIDLNTINLPVEQWSREFLCVDLLSQYYKPTPNSILTFYHQLTQLELYKKYEIYSEDRDKILRALIRKQKHSKLDLSTINTILIYLQTSSDGSIDILHANDSNWLLNMRKFYIRDKLNKYHSNHQNSKLAWDHIVDRICQMEILSVEFIEYFFRIVNQLSDILRFVDMITIYHISKQDLNSLFSNEKNIVNDKTLIHQFEVIILNKSVKEKWTGPKDQLIRARQHMKIMMNNGWTFDKIYSLVKNVKSDVESFESLTIFLDSLNILNTYKIDEGVECKLSQIFSTDDMKYWKERTHNLAIDRRFGPISSEKNLETLLREIEQVNNCNLSDQLTEAMKQIADAFNSDSSMAKQNNPINRWTISDIKNWAKAVFPKLSNGKLDLNLSEMIAVAKRAVYLHSTYEPRSIQILAILIMLDPNHKSGRLLQILTGEGKSSVVSILAVIKALQGKCVDIVTSSITLAKRDAEERSNFYSMFNLTVSHNNDETTYVKGPKKCYDSHIVYGTSSQFQFDILRHEFSLLDTRQTRRFDVVIIDEVDSMLIDENNTLARLADHLPGMEWLNPFLYGIWQCICANDNLLENKNSLIQMFKDRFNDPQFELKVPNHLLSFASDSLPLWVEHAIRAKVEYQLDHHYMIKSDETRTKRIVPIDFSNTGVVQSSTTWSDGLHQFLQIKHGLKMTPLTVTTNFLSNISLFTRYGNEIYGLTGTIGSQEAKDLLLKIYQVDTIVIPPFRQKRHYQLETILTSTDEDWLKSIVSTTVSHAKSKQAVLIICETRLDAKAITRELQCAYPTGSIRLYTDNTDVTESNVVSTRIQSGNIIVATNLAGRGTDLKMSPEVENNGGLHVCLTFLSNNLRVEEQAIGRTSRQGNRGTSQMILSETRTFQQLMSSYPAYLTTLTNQMDDSIRIMRQWREKAESAHLDQIWTKEIPEIKRRDELFRQFCELLAQLRKQNDDSYKLLSVKERWGLWLKSMDINLQNRETLQRLAEEIKFRSVEMPRDGNSFIRTLVHYFNGKLTFEDIKKKLIKHVEENRHLYESMDEEARHWAACRALNINIILFRSDYVGPKIYKRAKAQMTCFMGYEVNTHYVPFHPLQSDMEWHEILSDIESDQFEKEEKLATSKKQSSKLSRLIHKMTKAKANEEYLFTTRIVPIDLEKSFAIFRDEIIKQYKTEDIIENPCYLMLEADNIIRSLSTWSNSIRAVAACALPIEKAKTADDAIKRLEKAIKLDPVFSFSASANRAFLVIKNGNSESTYKITAKSYLVQAQQQIENFILPQLYSMQVQKKAESNEFVFEALTRQIETKIEILHHYHNYIRQAITIIEDSQKLTDVYCKHKNTVSIARKLYRQDVIDYVKNHSESVIDLHFYNLTVTQDGLWKNDQALELIDIQGGEYENISISYLGINQEMVDKITSKTSLINVSLDLKYLDKNEIESLIGNHYVTLQIETSSEQYLSALQSHISSRNVTIHTDCQILHLSVNEAINYLKDENNSIKSVSFESLDQSSVNEIVAKLEKLAISLTFTNLTITQMKDICKNVSKPFSIHFQRLSKSDAQSFIESTTERNFIITLHELSMSHAVEILRTFNRKEQDVKASLKAIAQQCMQGDSILEELNNYKNMGVIQLIVVEELNPRPWISICTIAGLGFAQIAGGVILAAATCGLGVQLGIALITEGVSDIYFAVRGAISRNLSWKDYAIQKGISLTLCFVTLGCSAISQAAKAVQGTKGTFQFMKETLRGAGNLIKNSARTLGTGALTGVASNTFKLAFKQVAITCVETGIRELANYATDATFDTVLSPLKSAINDEIRIIIDAEKEKDYYDRILVRCLIIDILNGNDQWRQNFEETAIKILTKQNSEFTAIAKSLGMGISNAVVRHAQSFTQSSGGKGSSVDFYLKWGKRLLTVIPAIHGSYEIATITNKFLQIFQHELIQLEQKMPKFEDFLQKEDASITEQVATEITQLLEKHEIIDSHGFINVQFTVCEDKSDFTGQYSSTHTQTNTPVLNVTQKLTETLKNINFADEKHRTIVLNILNRQVTVKRTSLKTNMMETKIIEILTNQVMTIIHGTMVGPLTNFVVGTAISALSEMAQLKLDPKGTVSSQLMEAGAQRYISNLSNDLIRDVQAGKVKLPPDAEKKLDDLVVKSKDKNFKPENFAEELALGIADKKQGGVIELAVIAALSGKPISVLESDKTDEANPNKENINLSYSQPKTDENGNFQDGHYEQVGGTTVDGGPQNCLYASTLEKTSETFTDVGDMRKKCAAFILSNPQYVNAILPAVNIINGNANPIRRKQLLMEGGQPREGGNDTEFEKIKDQFKQERAKRNAEKNQTQQSEENQTQQREGNQAQKSEENQTQQREGNQAQKSEENQTQDSEKASDKNNQNIIQGPNGFQAVTPDDPKNPVDMSITRTIKDDSDGKNPVKRVEYLGATIKKEHLREKRVSFPNSRDTSTKYMKNNLDSQPTDDRGHVVASALGGPPESYNMVPQNKNVNRGFVDSPDWHNSEREMAKHVNSTGGSVALDVSFNYPSDNTGRPSSQDWRATFYDSEGNKTGSSTGHAENKAP